MCITYQEEGFTVAHSRMSMKSGRSKQEKTRGNDRVATVDAQQAKTFRSLLTKIENSFAEGFPFFDVPLLPTMEVSVQFLPRKKRQKMISSLATICFEYETTTVTVPERAYLGTSDLLKTPKLLTEVGEADRVMKDAVRPKIVRIRPTNKANHGKILTVRARDGIDHTQTSHGERHGAGPNAVGARVPIRSVTRIQLIATSDEVKTGLRKQVVKQNKVKVAGHGEQVANPHFDKAGCNVAAQRPWTL